MVKQELNDVHDTDAHEESNCPECDGGIVQDPDRGESYCTGCGYVSKEKLEDPTSPIDLENGETPHHAKDIPSSRISSLPRINKDHLGKPLSPTISNMMYRLKVQDARAAEGARANKTIRRVVPKIKAWCNGLGLGEAQIASATKLYLRLFKENLVSGRSAELLGAGAINVVCRLENIPRSTQQIAQIASLPKTQVARAYYLIIKELKLSPEIPDPIRFIPGIVSMLHLPETVARTSAAIISDAKETGITVGKSPLLMAGAAVYLTILKSNLRPSQLDVSKAVGSSAPGLRESARVLNEALNLGIVQCMRGVEEKPANIKQRSKSVKSSG